jgi:hypothetical protein
MIAYNPRIPPDRRRTLSAEVSEQLRAALEAHWQQSPRSGEQLASALWSAARDAKEHQLRPEELLLAMKALERQVAESLASGVPVDLDERDEFRHWLVGACLRAYFGSEEG